MQVEIDALQRWQLQALLGTVGPQCQTVEGVVNYLIERAIEGIRRPGSWEREWIERCFGDFMVPEGALTIAFVSAWERPSRVASPAYPAGWIGRVVRGDDTIIFDSPPQPTREAALARADQWLFDHPEYRDVAAMFRVADEDQASYAQENSHG